MIPTAIDSLDFVEAVMFIEQIFGTDNIPEGAQKTSVAACSGAFKMLHLAL
jgi:hypothetical protein